MVAEQGGQEAGLILTKETTRNQVEVGEFAGAPVFAGSRAGFVFKMGTKGLGYYSDTAAKAGGRKVGVVVASSRKRKVKEMKEEEEVKEMKEEGKDTEMMAETSKLQTDLEEKEEEVYIYLYVYMYVCI